MYKNGQGVKRDYQKAMEHFLLSASQGNPKAQNTVGIHFVYVKKKIVTYL